jgi:DNA-damage-inducible protein J
MEIKMKAQTLTQKGKTTAIHARIEPKLKQEAEKIFAEVGLTMSEAIKLFLNQVRLNNGLPFEVRVPNKETRKAFADSRARKGLTSYSSVDELFDKFK